VEKEEEEEEEKEEDNQENNFEIFLKTWFNGTVIGGKKRGTILKK
jgi:hypothetical protein